MWRRSLSSAMRSTPRSGNDSIIVLAVILEQRPGLVLGAVSTPAAPGLAVKLVARYL